MTDERNYVDPTKVPALMPSGLPYTLEQWRALSGEERARHFMTFCGTPAQLETLRRAWDAQRRAEPRIAADVIAHCESFARRHGLTFETGTLTSESVDQPAVATHALRFRGTVHGVPYEAVLQLNEKRVFDIAAAEKWLACLDASVEKLRAAGDAS